MIKEPWERFEFINSGFYLIRMCRLGTINCASMIDFDNQDYMLLQINLEKHSVVAYSESIDIVCAMNLYNPSRPRPSVL